MAQDVIINEIDCGTIDGIFVSAIMEGGEILEPLRDRIVGRVSQEDIYDPMTGEVIIGVGQEITEALATPIQAAGIERVKIRSVLTCEIAPRRVRPVLRPQPGDRPHGRHRRGGRRHRRAVDRRAGHPAHHAHLPLRRHRQPRVRAVEAHRQEPGHGASSSTSRRSRASTATWW